LWTFSLRANFLWERKRGEGREGKRRERGGKRREEEREEKNVD